MTNGARPDKAYPTSAYTSAMFSETRYATNGDLRVAYRASPPGARDIVFVPNWFTCCELLPELPSTQVRGDDIGGIGVHIGARVSALAGANEVLVSSTLRDLVIGSGLEFEERGAYELKGVAGEWHLFAVASS
jgi:hypothetical protein